MLYSHLNLCKSHALELSHGWQDVDICLKVGNLSSQQLWSLWQGKGIFTEMIPTLGAFTQLSQVDSPSPGSQLA
jgi:hypothetical protein